MKIKKSDLSFQSARSILEFLKGEVDCQDFNVALSDGDLVFNSNVHPIQENETVLIERLEPDSMGDGWDDADPIDVINWIEDNCEA